MGFIDHNGDGYKHYNHNDPHCTIMGGFEGDRR